MNVAFGQWLVDWRPHSSAIRIIVSFMQLQMQALNFCFFCFKTKEKIKFTQTGASLTSQGKES